MTTTTVKFLIRPTFFLSIPLPDFFPSNHKHSIYRNIICIIYIGTIGTLYIPIPTCDSWGHKVDGKSKKIKSCWGMKIAKISYGAK
jgi:hypothetical protein